MLGNKSISRTSFSKFFSIFSALSLKKNLISTYHRSLYTDVVLFSFSKTPASSRAKRSINPLRYKFYHPVRRTLKRKQRVCEEANITVKFPKRAPPCKNQKNPPPPPPHKPRNIKNLRYVAPPNRSPRGRVFGNYPQIQAKKIKLRYSNPYFFVCLRTTGAWISSVQFDKVLARKFYSATPSSFFHLLSLRR